MTKLFTVLALCCAGFACVEIGILARDLHREIPRVDATLGHVQAIETDTARTVQLMGGLANTSRQIALNERDSQAKQLAAIQQIAAKSTILIDDADASIKQLGIAAQSLSAIGPEANNSLIQVTSDTSTLLRSGTLAVDSAAADLDDPHFKQILGYVADSSAQVDATTTNLNDSSKDIKDYVHRETAPVRGTWNSIKELINLVWSIRGAAGI